MSTYCFAIKRFLAVGVVVTALTGSAWGQGILFHGSGTEPTGGADGEVFAHLVDRFGAGAVTYMQGDMAAADGSSANGFDAVIISSTLGSGTVRNKYEDLPLPVMNWEQALMDSNQDGDFHLSTGGRTKGSQEEIEIVDPNHFLAAGLSGTVRVFDSPQTVSLGTGDVGPGVQVIGHAAGEASESAIFVAEQGEALTGDGTDGKPAEAPARRLMFFIEDNSFNALTDEGLLLFDAAVGWILFQDQIDFTPGDFNDDGAIDLADFEILKSNFNQRFPFVESFAKGDNTRDTRVNLEDFLEFATLFAEANARAAAVPEPSTLVLASLAIASVWFTHRRRSHRR